MFVELISLISAVIFLRVFSLHPLQLWVIDLVLRSKGSRSEANAMKLMSSGVYHVNHQGEPNPVISCTGVLVQEMTGLRDEARWGTLYVAASRTQHTLVHGQPMGSHALLSRFIQVSLRLQPQQLLRLSCKVAYQARSFCTSQGWKFYL